MAANNQSNELKRLGAVPLASIVVGCALALVATIFWLQVQVNESHRHTLVANAADSLQSRLNQQQAELIKQLESVASSSQLIDIVRNAEAEVKAREEARLQSVIADAIKVRLFAIGEAEIDRDARPPLTYTSLDLVNRVEAGLDVFPEAVNFGDRWVLSVASPLSPRDDNTVYGTLFVYLQMDAISDALTDKVSGELVLSQHFDNAPTNQILVTGKGRDPQATPVVRDLANPHWQMQFTPGTGLTSTTIANPILFVIPLAIFLIVALIGTAVGILRTRTAIEADATRLSNQVTDAINADFEPSSEYHFSSFVDIDANLARVGKKAEQPKKPVEPLKTAAPKAQPRREEMVDIEMIDEDTYQQELDKSGESEEHSVSEQDLAAIFRAYDIRGIVNQTLTPEVIHKIAQAIGSEAGARGEQTLLVGADGRVSSPSIKETLIEGLRATGRDVIDLGTVPTPLMYFATRHTDAASGVMITGSHNPPEYNGFKIVFDGRTLVERDIHQLYQRFVNEDFESGEGNLSQLDIADDYVDAVCDDVVVARPLKVIVDCGNGVSGSIAPALFANLGCDVIPLYCEVDGNFPNHPPDPTVPENLDDLILMVKSQRADLGIALDGDGDRVIAVTPTGEIVWPDNLLMLFAKDVVALNPGSDVVYDVKCTRHLNGVISGFGGRPIICRSGHSFVKEKLAETGAVLGGEFSGHICFNDRWTGFDDGLYAAARLLEIVGSESSDLNQRLGEFPVTVATPEIHVPVAEDKKFQIIRRLLENADFPEGTVSTTDGMRVDFSDGWGLIRASNTNPALTLRFEADTDASLQKIKEMFRQQLKSVDSKLDFQG